MIEKNLNEKNIAEVIEMRRWLHTHAELSENEFQTMDYICERLTEWGIPFRKGVAETGVVGLIEGTGEGPTVALRADIDALPIIEETGLPFASKNEGVGHACGHDAHTAILLEVAHILSQKRKDFCGKVKLLFQPAEETIGGAKRMIEDGCMQNPEVDYVLGLHVEPTLDVGQVGVRYGKMYAASDMIDLKIKGKGSHGAHPDEGVDAIMVAAMVLQGVQNIVGRNVSPLESAVCTFGRIEGGLVRNQIADEVKMQGILRTLTPEMRHFFRNRVIDVAVGTGKLMGAEVEVNLMESYGPLINNDAVTSIVEQTMVKMLGREQVIVEKEPDLGCEDFSYFATEKPGCYYHLGCHNPKEEEHIDLHNPRFTIDEDCLAIGVALQVKNVLAFLGK